MRKGGDSRGGAPARRNRKHWMLHWFGDGETAPCTHCRDPLDFETIEADRIVPGGPYARHNIQPACRGCNARRGNSIINPFRPRSLQVA